MKISLFKITILRLTPLEGLSDMTLVHTAFLLFRGFYTERARLGTFNHNFEIFTQNEHLPTQKFFFFKFSTKIKKSS